MPDYQDSIVIEASAHKVFEFVSRVENLPHYLPTTKHAQALGGDRIRVQGQVEDQTYDQDGRFRAIEGERLEWGSDGDRDYHGWMDIRDMGGRCEVTVAIHLNPPAEERQQMESRGPGGMDSKMQDGVRRALESIKNHCEGRGGKVEAPVSQNPNVSMQ